jgi:exodeoxyribonuclease III
MKIVTWNINGIRAVAGKGLFEFWEKEQPDILCLQETKAHPDQLGRLFRSRHILPGKTAKR